MAMPRSLIPPHLPGAESDLAALQAGAAATASVEVMARRIAHDELLGEIDVDRMERVMNSEVEVLRTGAVGVFLERQNLIDHFTRNSPQPVLNAMRERLHDDRFRSFADAVREVMYDIGQTVVPQGYVVEISEVGSVRLARQHGAAA